MNRRRKVYEGKAKILYEGPEPGTLVQHFKDDATAFNNKKRDKIEGKGVLNNRISEYLFQKLGEIGVPTHFIKRLNMREQLIREVEIIPLEVVVRNVAAGSLSTRLGSGGISPGFCGICFESTGSKEAQATWLVLRIAKRVLSGNSPMTRSSSSRRRRGGTGSSASGRRN